MMPPRFRYAIALLLLCIAGQVTGEEARQTDTAAGSFRARFPAGSFDSTAKADAALAAAGNAKRRAETDYKAAARACLGKFLVNACIDDTRGARRVRLAEIEAVELEANRAKRQERGARVEAERAGREAERAAAETSDARTREQNREAFFNKQESAKQNEADRAASAAAHSASPAKRRPAVKAPPRQDGSAQAAQRRKNAAEQAEKVRQAAAHRAQLERRRAQKEADRARRAKAQAGKSGNAPAPANP